MTLSIYLNFDGDCREAFEFYRSVFGGDFDVINTFGKARPWVCRRTSATGSCMFRTG